MLLISFHLFSWLEVTGVLFCDKLLRFIFLPCSLFFVCIFSVCNYFVIKWIQNSSYLNMVGNFWRIKGAFMDFPGSSVGKEAACSAGDLDSITGSGRSPGEANGDPPQHSCLENPMERGPWGTIVHGVTRVGRDLTIKPPPRVHFAVVTLKASKILIIFYLWSVHCIKCIYFITHLLNSKCLLDIPSWCI